MKIPARLTATAALAAAITLAGACSKEAPAAQAATRSSQTSVASVPPADTQAAPLAPTASEVAPGTPVVTFTPSSDTAAPMLPTLGAIPPAIDEHSQTLAKAAVRRIAPDEAAMLLSTGDAILVDVRSADSFEAGHIKGAVSIPFNDLAARARAELPPTRWIIPYCT